MKTEIAADRSAWRWGGFGGLWRGRLGLALLALVLLAAPLQAQWGGYSTVIHDWTVRKGDVRFGLLEVRSVSEFLPAPTNSTTIFFWREVVVLKAGAKEVLAIALGTAVGLGFLTWAGKRLTIRR